MKLTPWSFATFDNKALNNRHVVEVVSYPTPAKTIMVRAIPQFPGTLLEVPVSSLSPCTYRPVAVSYARVGGNGSFPFDMLRYDSAVPANFRLDDDFGIVIDPEWDGNGLIVAKVLCKRSVTDGGFTLGRWSSFNWGCLPFRIEAINGEKAA